MSTELQGSACLASLTGVTDTYHTPCFYMGAEDLTEFCRHLTDGATPQYWTRIDYLGVAQPKHSDDGLDF